MTAGANSFDYDRWKQAIEDCGLTTDFYNSRARGKDEIFPWEYTSCGVSRKFLWSEYEKRPSRRPRPMIVKRDTCTGCGVCQQLGIKIIDWKGKNV